MADFLLCLSLRLPSLRRPPAVCRSSLQFSPTRSAILTATTYAATHAAHVMLRHCGRESAEKRGVNEENSGLAAFSSSRACSSLSFPGARSTVPVAFLARSASTRHEADSLSLPLGSTTAGSSECSHCMLVLAPQNSYASVSCSTAEIFISIRGNWWLREPPHHDRSGRCRHRQDPARDRTSHGTPMRH